MKRLTQGSINTIENALREGLRVTEIAELYGFTQSTVSYHKNKIMNCKKTKKICPNCKCETTNAMASFCWHCGASIKTKREQLIDRLGELMSLSATMPQSARDELQKIVLETIRFLKNGEDGE